MRVDRTIKNCLRRERASWVDIATASSKLLWNDGRVETRSEIESYAGHMSYRVSFEVSELPR